MRAYVRPCVQSVPAHWYIHNTRHARSADSELVRVTVLVVVMRSTTTLQGTTSFSLASVAPFHGVDVTVRTADLDRAAANFFASRGLPPASRRLLRLYLRILHLGLRDPATRELREHAVVMSFEQARWLVRTCVGTCVGACVKR